MSRRACWLLLAIGLLAAASVSAQDNDSWIAWLSHAQYAVDETALGEWARLEAS